jgi:5'-3' exonuclease
LRGAGSIAAKLARQREAALLSRRLATIVADAPVDGNLERLAWAGPRWDRLDPLLDRLGFQRIRSRIPGHPAESR